ncbi:adenylate/guanylate cyclase [Vibrio sp. S11_S32]|uniref:adenylate/guanylate cyclase n=1 Tax=Vibrio sp. S11_S32 TaxID=2720225 RepID=UPI001680F75D|nr:adenylate/guanylate cyclase [Vibrio sp. S11_S32]MBD1578013.1 adenylate/guanylate cyclase [Vibrio sp. S11_S32]
MLENEKNELQAIINASLNEAEKHWQRGGFILEALNRKMEDSVQPSNIPGHKIVRDDETVIDEFIAFVADMRNSTDHLMCAISSKNADVSGLQRVYYETSALLPSLAHVVSKENGKVTEFLGDGVLALFQIDPEAKEEAIYASHRAAKKAVNNVRQMINEELKKRYRLPPIDIGVGLATSKALVTLVGLPQEKQPKAFGECIFRATKLSSGQNEIICDQNLKAMWPSSKGGTISFKQKPIKNAAFTGYLIGTS